MQKFLGLGMIAIGFIGIAPVNIAVGMVVALVGLIMTWSSEKSINRGTDYRSPEQKEYRLPCPYCAEMIKPEAIICRYCGSDITDRQ